MAYIALTKGYVAMVDATDLPMVQGYAWTAKEHRRADGSLRGLYAYRKERVNGKARNVYLHRVIAGCPDGRFVDHADRDGLNNTRSNLRVATGSENQWNKAVQRNNTTGAKGVMRSRNGRWDAEIRAAGVRHRIGRFDTKEQAMAAHAEAAARLHGEFARVA